jgi:hypothetical protein
MIRNILLTIAFSALVLVLGCSRGGANDPTSASPDEVTGDSERASLGIYSINIDPETQSAQIVPDRESAYHMSAKGFLLGWPCSNCLTIKNLHFLPGNQVECDIEITHPISDPVYTVFDLRVIAIFPPTEYYYGLGVSHSLLNKDGLTNLWDSKSVPGFLNGYKAYNKTQPRRIFPAGSVSTEHFLVQLPTGGLNYSIAVDASWMPNDGINFPLAMNAFEVIDLNGSVSSGLTDIGGTAIVTANMYDYQGTSTIASVKAYSDVLFNGPITMSYVSGDGNNAVYSAVIQNQKHVAAGNYHLIVRAIDTEDSHYTADIASYAVLDVNVAVGNVEVTLAEDADYRTIGNSYNYKTYIGAAGTGVINYLDTNGPWDFRSLSYTSTAQRSILSPSDPELISFASKFPTAEYFVKDAGNFGMGGTYFYSPEKHDYARNMLVPLGLYDTYMFGGSVVFSGTLNGHQYPYNTSTSYNFKGKVSSVIELKYTTLAMGKGECIVPMNSGTSIPALLTRTKIEIKIIYPVLKTIIYQWWDTDGNLLAVESAMNPDGETANWNESTYVITGTGTIQALDSMNRQ